MAVKKAAELNLFGNTKCGQKKKTIRRTGRSLKEKPKPTTGGVL